MKKLIGACLLALVALPAGAADLRVEDARARHRRCRARP